MSSYAPLHVHTHYSLFDGIATPQEYVDRAVSVGMTSISITDHGSLSGHREMYRAAKAAGIKPILSNQFLVSKGTSVKTALTTKRRTKKTYSI